MNAKQYKIHESFSMIQTYSEMLKTEVIDERKLKIQEKIDVLSLKGDQIHNIYSSTITMEDFEKISPYLNEKDKKNLLNDIKKI